MKSEKQNFEKSFVVKHCTMRNGANWFVPVPVALWYLYMYGRIYLADWCGMYLSYKAFLCIKNGLVLLSTNSISIHIYFSMNIRRMIKTNFSYSSIHFSCLAFNFYKLKREIFVTTFQRGKCLMRCSHFLLL